MCLDLVSNRNVLFSIGIQSGRHFTLMVMNRASRPYFHFIFYFLVDRFTNRVSITRFNILGKNGFKFLESLSKNWSYFILPSFSEQLMKCEGRFRCISIVSFYVINIFSTFFLYLFRFYYDSYFKHLFYVCFLGYVNDCHLVFRLKFKRSSFTFYSLYLSVCFASKI